MANVLLIREGNHLTPADPISLEEIQAMAHGEYVTAKIERARNPKHHRKYFALLKIILDNQDKYADIDSLLTAIKVGVGHCTWGTVWLRGVPFQVAIPKSISFSRMGQGKFEKFYDASVDYIVADIIPGLDRPALEQRVLEMMA